MQRGAVAGMAMSHIRMLFNELEGYEADILRNDPLTMYCDSASAITIVNLDKDIKSLRHCKRRLLFMRQLRIEGEQQFKHIRKEDMLADGGTKNLDADSVQKLNDMLLTEVNA